MGYFDEMDALAGISPPNPAQKSSNSLFSEMDALASQPPQEAEHHAEQSPDNGSFFNKFSLENLSKHGGLFRRTVKNAPKLAIKGATSVLDIPQAFAGLLAPNPEDAQKALESYGIKGAPQGANNHPLHKIANARLPSKIIQKEVEKNTGLNLEPEADSGAERIFNSGVEYALSMLSGGALGNMAKGAAALPQIASKGGKYVGKAAEFLLGAPSTAKEAAGLAKLGALTGVASQGLQEAGVNPATAGISASLGIPVAGAAGKVAYRATKAAAKHAGTAVPGLRGVIGERDAAKFLQEQVGRENIPGVVQNIDNYSPGIEGYHPPTADIADNVGLSQYHRAASGTSPKIGERQQENARILKEAIERAAPEGADARATQQHIAETQGRLQKKTSEAKSLRDTTGDVEEFGEGIRSHLEDKVGRIQKEASDKTRHLYEGAYSETPHLKPTGTQSFLQEQMKKWSGDIRSDLKQVSADIAAEPGELKKYTAAKKAREEALAKFDERYASSGELQIPDKVKQQLKEEYQRNQPELKEPLPESRKIAHAISNINAKIEKLQPTERTRRKVLRETVSQLEKDLENLKGRKEANEIYRETMEPANRITEHPTFKTFLKENPGFIHYNPVSGAQIPKKVVSGARSLQDASDLLPHIKENSQLHAQSNAYIENLFLKEVVSDTGHVMPDKFDAFMKKYPGATKLYPELGTVLKNRQNAQTFANRVIGNNEKMISKYHEAAAQSVLGSSPDRVVASIFKGKNPQEMAKKVVEMAKTDKSGVALPGLQASTIKHLQKSMTDNMTYYRLNGYLKTNREALSEILNPEQMDVLGEVLKKLKEKDRVSRQGVGYNSSTVEKTINLAKSATDSTIKHLFGKMGKTAWDLLLEMNPKQKYLEQALLDPQMFKRLISMQIKDKKTLSQALKEVKQVPKQSLRLLKTAVPLEEGKE